jgi:hypothetical protein
MKFFDRPVWAVCLLTFSCTAGELQPQTVKAFDDYVKKVEASMASGDRALPNAPDAQGEVGRGEIAAVPFANRQSGGVASVPIPDGLINHWFGATFIPNATVAQVRAVLEDYNNYARYYAPDVAESKLISRSGDAFDVALRLNRQVRVKAALGYSFPVEFNARYRVSYAEGGGVLRVRSLSTRIAQVRDPKRSHTDEYPEYGGDGYLWRLYSYWRVYPGANQGVNGVYVESEAVSLSRSVPGFVEKMVAYFTANFPRDSMESTLAKTRSAVKSRDAQYNHYR